MMLRCSVHGDQPCCLVSPDLISKPKSVGESNTPVVIVTLMNGDLVDFYVTITTEFAQQHGVKDLHIATEDALDWFSLVKSMCSECYFVRWPQYRKQIEK